MVRQHVIHLFGIVALMCIVAAAALGFGLKAPAPQHTACGVDGAPPCTAPIGIAQSANPHLSSRAHIHLA